MKIILPLRATMQARIIFGILSFSSFHSINSAAQTTLARGDIAIVEFCTNCTPKTMAFVSWVDLSNTTVIKFTNNAFNSSASATAANNGRASQQGFSWTNNTGSTISAGTVITFTGSGAAGAASLGSVSPLATGSGGNGTYPVQSVGGGKWFVYQGSDYSNSAPTSTFSGTILYGLTFPGIVGAPGFISSGSASNFITYLPSELNAAGFNIAGFGSTNYTSQYTGSRTGSATMAAYQALVSNPANWASTTSTIVVNSTNFSATDVSPTFVLGSPQTMTVCENATATDFKSLLNISDADASQTESWSQSAAPSHGTLNFTSATAASGSTNISPGGIITYTPTNGYSGSDAFTVQVSDGTVTANMVINVTINPQPTITTSTFSSTCSGTGPNISLAATSASTFAWTLGTNTGAIAGASASSGSTINQSLTNPSNSSPGSIVYTVTPTATTGACAGPATNITVTVNPKPAMTTAATQTICSGTSTDLSLTASVSSTFAWTLGTNTGSISGASSGAGTSISQLLTNPDNNNPGSIVYTVTPTSITGTCAGAPSDITVTVNNAPGIIPGSYPSVTFGASTANLTYSGAAGNPSTYSITWTGIASGLFTDINNAPLPAGNIALDIPAGAAAPNVYAGSLTVSNGTCQSIVYPISVTINADLIPPTVTSIDRLNPASASTNATTLVYRITFSEQVTGVDITDFTLFQTGTASGSVSSVSTSAGTTIDVTVNSVSGDGDIRLDLNNSATGITDLSANALSGGFNTGQSYTLDHTAPAVISVDLPANGNYNTGETIDFTVNWNKAVNVDLTGGIPFIPVTLNSGGTVEAAYISGNGTSSLLFSYTITSGDADPDGISVASSLNLNGGLLRDAVGNDAVTTMNGLGSTLLIKVNTMTLPVRWLSFTARQAGKNVQLDWSTAFEQNTKDYIIQTSTNNSGWKDLAAITAAGNSSSPLSYRFLHLSPAEGQNNYRIIQTDLDGKSSISEIRSVKFMTTLLPFAVINNPVQNGMLKLQVNETINLSIYNTSGSLILKTRLIQGLQTLDMSRLSQGLYWLQGNNLTKQVLLQ